ncbi:sensor histidine kinase [Streptomyces jumonjinensis]|uniref:histidine kinase n=1 Tax=Streptomyces jumonjinensis TaxID=1945 RepID=A0A646KSA5_STRJU|nr:ATP-binding protein [Streptomyces jumonjinensis]MQT04970.1 HAMP domain-containing protein [Streptomyces jumonjinensis]
MRVRAGRAVHAGPGRLGPGSAIRTRIAFVYGAVFLVLGAVLLAFVYLLASAGTQTEAAAIARRAAVGEYGPPAVLGRDLERLSASQLTDNVSDAASEQLLFWSLTGLLVAALCAVVAGWWTAGRMLRPVHEMTARARGLSERTLHERIAASGPDDELKELGDTLDALLARLERAFDSQRRFIANASHELRTPLATQRTAIQVGLASADPGDVAATREILLESNRRSERLIEGLLMLAHGERGLDHREDVDLGEAVAEEALRHRVTAEVSGAGVVRGNRLLLDRMAGNLVANAVAYNVPGGTVSVRVTGGELTVENTGPAIAAEDVPGLFEPFRRGEGRDRMGPGAGLGLSIVRSIAQAHDGEVTARPGPEGGLTVTVSLPVVRPVKAASS